jgi:tRNA G18 (ribose-2'-O)-methylase SpoU
MAGAVLPEPIDDPADPRLEPFIGLTDAALRRRREEAGAFFVAESVQVVQRLLARGQAVRAVVVTPAAFARLAVDLERARPVPAVYLVERPVLAAVAGFDVHRGVLAAVARPPARDPDDVIAGAGRLLAVLEGVNDQENLGVIFRNAAGLGVGGVLLCPRCCDPLYRRTVRVSMGEVLAVPWARAAPWPAGLDAVRRAGYVLEALTPAADLPIARRAGERVAVMLGSEGDGLSSAALAAADRRAAIPMQRGVDSLNVAAASAIAFHVHGPAYDPAR